MTQYYSTPVHRNAGSIRGLCHSSAETMGGHGRQTRCTMPTECVMGQKAGDMAEHVKRRTRDEFGAVASDRTVY